MWRHTNTKHVDQEYVKNNKKSAKLQDSDKVGLYKKDEK